MDDDYKQKEKEYVDEIGEFSAEMLFSTDKIENMLNEEITNNRKAISSAILDYDGNLVDYCGHK